MMINRLLLLDAATCALMGLLLAFAAPGLSTLFDLPENLLFYAGLVLFPIALFMAVLSRQSRPSPAGIWLVVLGNAAWVVASLGVLAYGRPNGLGTGFVLVQAIVVAALAWAEWIARPRHGLSAA